MTRHVPRHRPKSQSSSGAHASSGAEPQAPDRPPQVVTTSRTLGDAPGSNPAPASEVPAHAAREVERQLAQPLAPGLYLVATPIGNLADITLRALATLSRADVVLCEDTRHSRTLLAHFGIRARAEPYHEHNADQMRPRVLANLAEGKSIALISDAGTPLISDPGYKLVREALAAGYTVECVPGACAAIAALAPSGLPTDSFHFAGFLPPRSGQRGTRITALAAIPSTLVFYEAPQRLAETLADLAAILGPRLAVIARELTKLHEETLRGTLPELAMLSATREIRGEIVLLVGPPLDVEITDAEIIERLSAALQSQSLRDAAKAVADALGVPKARVYDLGLKVKQGA